MKLKTIYLAFSVLGLILPYWQFVPWVAEHGLNMHLFFEQLFSNRISAFFGMDVFVSAAAFLVFSASESRRLGIRGHVWATLALITVGVSLALPLFLYMRESQMVLTHTSLKPAAT